MTALPPVPDGGANSGTGPLTAVSLFAGIGGIDLGLERAGITVIAQVEKNPFCRRVLAHHWPEVPQHDDVLTFNSWWDSEARPPVDLVAGGYPCQPFSLSGKQLGINDERWLWPAMADVVRHLRPRYVLVENVASLVRDADAFGWMLGDLAALGFDAEWSVLSAPEFGAPQAARERLYLVAYTPGVDGLARHRLGARGDRRASLAVGGLSGLPLAARRESARAWLAAEPRVGRLADGIPDQVDRLAAYGNAVLPIAAEHIGRLIVDDAHAGAAA